MGKMLILKGLTATTPVTTPKKWASFVGGTTPDDPNASYATLNSPLTLSQSGDFIEFDIIMPTAAEQPMAAYPGWGGLDYSAWYPGAFSRSIIGSTTQISYATWFGPAEGGNLVWDGEVKTSPSYANFVLGGQHHMRLEIEATTAKIYTDGSLTATYPRSAGQNFTVDRIGDANTIYISVDTPKLISATFKMRDLRIQAAGTLHTFGHLTDSDLVTLHRVTEVEISTGN